MKFKYSSESYLASRSLWDPRRKQTWSVIYCIIRCLFSFTTINHINYIINGDTCFCHVCCKNNLPNSILGSFKNQFLFPDWIKGKSDQRIQKIIEQGRGRRGASYQCVLWRNKQEDRPLDHTYVAIYYNNYFSVPHWILINFASVNE